MKKPLIVILGPTASGKTAFSIKLAQKFSGEIICADSRTIYENMDIGTAKPGPAEQKIVPHYLLDIIKPDQEFSVAEFQKLALEKISKISKKGKVPFLVGGTGLYIDAVSEGFLIPKIKADFKLRQKLEKSSLSELLNKLKKLDTLAYRKIDKNNKRRIIRALEVCLKTGKKFSDLQLKNKPDLRILKIGLKLSREKLYENINQRVEKMIKAGLVNEVKKLYKMGYDFNSPALSGLGYFEIYRYLKKEISLKDAVEKIKQRTRNFAKRQMTWFKKDPKIKWIISKKQAEKLISKFLQKD